MNEQWLRSSVSFTDRNRRDESTVFSQAEAKMEQQETLSKREVNRRKMGMLLEMMSIWLKIKAKLGLYYAADIC